MPDALESELRGVGPDPTAVAFALWLLLQPEHADINEMIGGIVKRLT